MSVSIFFDTVFCYSFAWVNDRHGSVDRYRWNWLVDTYGKKNTMVKRKKKETNGCSVAFTRGISKMPVSFKNLMYRSWKTCSDDFSSTWKRRMSESTDRDRYIVKLFYEVQLRGCSHSNLSVDSLFIVVYYPHRIIFKRANVSLIFEEIVCFAGLACILPTALIIFPILMENERRQSL